MALISSDPNLLPFMLSRGGQTWVYGKTHSEHVRDKMLHSPGDGCLHSGGPCWLHLQRRIWKQQVHPKHGYAASKSSGQYKWSPVTAYIQWQFQKQVSFYLLDRYVSIGYNPTSQDRNHNYILCKKLRADWCEGMLATIWCIICCLPVCYPKI